MSILRMIAAAVFASAAQFALPAMAQEWPQKPIRIVVSFGPGGGADIVGRILASGLQDKLGQTVIVENRAGAAGTTGNEAIARSDKDGYTLGIMTAGQIIAAVMNKALRYDTMTAFDPVSMIGTASLMIAVRPDFPASNVKELVAVAKANPGKYIFASAGFGATQHMSAELFMQTAGIKMLHVPFRTSGEVIAGVLGGQVHVMFDTVSALLGQIQSKELKALAVTGKDRFPAVPNIPAAIESGLLPDYDVTTWYGVFVPAGTPPAVIAKLNTTLNGMLTDPAIRQRLVTAGLVVQGSTPEVFGKFMAAELKRWNAVRVAAGIPQN